MTMITLNRPIAYRRVHPHPQPPDADGVDFPPLPSKLPSRYLVDSSRSDLSRHLSETVRAISPNISSTSRAASHETVNERQTTESNSDSSRRSRLHSSSTVGRTSSADDAGRKSDLVPQTKTSGQTPDEDGERLAWSTASSMYCVADARVSGSASE